MEKDRGIIITNVDKQKQCDIHVVSNTEGKLLCEDCNKADRYLMFRVCEPCLIKGKYIAK